MCVVSDSLASQHRSMLIAAAPLQYTSRLDELKEPLIGVPPVNPAPGIRPLGPVERFPHGEIAYLPAQAHVANLPAQARAAAPSDPRSALYCSYCRKRGHDLAHCCRSVNDHKYLKRGR